MSLSERDYSLDWAKGITILSVIFLHNLPNYYIGSIAWIGQAVPLFLLITGYLTYSSFEKGKTIDSYFTVNNLIKMLNRIFVPFLIMTIIQSIIYFLFFDFSLFRVIKEGGIGPGSYYPWLYLQFWILLPFIIKLIDSASTKSVIVIFILISVLLEFFTCITELNPSIYRLLCYRYLFVVVLGCLTKKLNLKITHILILLAIFSLLFSLMETYTTINLEPFFTQMWKGYHWITAFYPILLFFLIRIAYKHIKYNKVKCFFVKLGNFSYEIFLCQMFVFSVFTPKFLNFINNIYIEKILYIGLTTILSILPILIYKEYIKKILIKRNLS